MANDINKDDPHYKGEFGSIYEVNQKFPSGGVAGDFVVIDSWAHYWNADRGTWCVNAKRDEYWDEEITTLDDTLKLKADKTELENAIKAQAEKDATQDTEIAKKANKTDLDSAISAQSVKDAAQDAEIAKKANSADVDAELAKKFDKSNIAQELGESTDKVVSQYALPLREIESPEFLHCIVDAEDHLLFGILQDGSVEWGKGIPAPIRSKLQEIISQSQDIQDSLNTAKEELTAAIASLQETKVDKEEGKSLIDDEVKECFNVIENDEFIHAITDSEDRVLFGIKRDTGKPFFPLNDLYHVIQNEEFLWVIVDSAEHPLLGIKADGECWAAKAKWLDLITDITKIYDRIAVDIQKKKISILGDSLSTFQGSIPSQNVSFYPNSANNVTNVKQMWWDILVNSVNAVLEVNNSYSGSKVSGTDESSFINRCKELGNPEYIIIHGGTNDSWANVPVGELHFDKGTEELNLSNFSDSYDCMVRNIIARYKYSNLILIIPATVSNDYANSIITICEHYSLFGYVDLRNTELNLFIGHYQEDAMQVVAEKVTEVISRNKNIEKIFGKSLVDRDFASASGSMSNNEFFSVETDADGKVLAATYPDGSHYAHNMKSETIPEEFSHIEDPEGRMEITTDADGKVIGYRDAEGTRHENKMSLNHLKLSDEAATEVNDAFKSAGIKMENPSDFSKDSHIELPIPRIAAQVRIYAPKLPTTKTDDIEAEIEYNDKDGNYFRKPVILNAQGSSSMGYYVKNMAIDLNDGSEIKFGDFPTQDSFHLKKYYIDAFRGQCIVGYWLMEQVYKSRPLGQQYPYEYSYSNESTTDGLGDVKKDFFTGAKCHPDGFPIIITWVNSNTGKETWMGVYAWNLKKSKEVYNCDKKKAENIILDGAIGKATLFEGNIDWSQFEIRNPKSLKDMDGNKYDGDNPKELSDTDTLSKTVKSYIQRLSGISEAIAESKTKETYEKYFLIPPFIDYFLTSMLLYNLDGFNKNWIWITYDGNHWTPTLYDVDSIFGAYWNGTYVVPNSDKEDFYEYHFALDIHEVFADEIAERYAELRKAKIFDADNIIGLLNKWLDKIGFANITKELGLYDETPSYRNSNINSQWELVGAFKTADDYDEEKEYQVGETCRYKEYVFKAKSVTKGIPPISKMYDKSPAVFGFHNSIERVYKWLVNRISFLDNKYNFK